MKIHDASMNRLSTDLEYGRNFVNLSDRFLTTIVVGTILLNFSYLLLPVIFLMGYYVRVLTGRFEYPPSFVDWRSLTVTGLKATLTAAIYVGMPVVTIGIVYTTLLENPFLQRLWMIGGDLLTKTGNRHIIAVVENGITALAALDPVALPGVVSLFLVFYLFPGILAHFATAEQWRIRDVLSANVFFDVIPVVIRLRYISAWLVAVGLSLVGIAAVWISALIPLFPDYQSNILALFAIFSYNLFLLVGYAIFFICQVAAYAVLGRAWTAIHPDREPTVSASRSGVESTQSEWDTGESITADGIRGALLFARQCMTPRQTLLVGGFIALLGDVFFPIVILGGYFASVLQYMINDNSRPPQFAAWPRLISNGIKMLAAWTLFLVLTIGLLSLLIASPWLEPVIVTAFGSLVGGTAVVPVWIVVSSALPSVGLLGHFGSVVVVACVIPALYLLPASLVLVAERESIRAAFASIVIRVAISPVYARRWLVSIVLGLVGWIPLISVLVMAPERETLAPGSTTIVLQRIAGTDSGFSSPLSFGVLPLRAIAAQETIPLYGALLLSGIIFFFFQVAAFAVIGRARRDIADRVKVTDIDSQDGVLSSWIRRGGVAGMIGGTLYIVFGVLAILPYLLPTLQDVFPFAFWIVGGLLYTVIWILVLPVTYGLMLVSLAAFTHQTKGQHTLAELVGIWIIGYGLLLEITIMTMSQWLYPAYNLNWKDSLWNFLWSLIDYALTPMRDINPEWWVAHLVGLLLLIVGSIFLGRALWQSDAHSNAAGMLFFVSALVPLGHFVLSLFGVILLSTGSLPLGFSLFGAAIVVLGHETWQRAE